MIYVNKTFTGHYPVGTAALVNAVSREEASRKLNVALKERGLVGDVSPEQMEPLTDADEVVILCDGNY